MTMPENPQVEKLNETSSGVSQGSSLVREALEMTYTAAGARQNDTKPGSMAGELLGNLLGNFTIEQNGRPLAGQEVNAEESLQSSPSSASDASPERRAKNLLKPGKVEGKVIPGSDANSEETRLKAGGENKKASDGVNNVINLERKPGDEALQRAKEAFILPGDKNLQMKLGAGALQKAEQAFGSHDKNPADGLNKPEMKQGIDGALQRAEKAFGSHDKKPADGFNKPQMKPGDGAMQQAEKAFRSNEKKPADGLTKPQMKPGDEMQRPEKAFKFHDRKPADSGRSSSEKLNSLPGGIGEKTQQRVRELLEQRRAAREEGSADVDETSQTATNADAVNAEAVNTEAVNTEVVNAEVVNADAVNAEAVITDASESSEETDTTEENGDTESGAFSIDSLMQRLDQQIDAMSQYLGFSAEGETVTPASDTANGEEQDGPDSQDGQQDGTDGEATEEGEQIFRKNKVSHLQGTVSPKSFQDAERIEPLLTALSNVSQHGGREAEQRLLDDLNASLERQGSDYRVAFGQNIIKTPAGRRLVLQSSEGQPIEVESNGVQKPLVVDFILRNSIKPRR